MEMQRRADRLDGNGAVICCHDIVKQCCSVVKIIHNQSPSLTYSAFMDMVKTMQETHKDITGVELPIAPFEAPEPTSQKVSDFAKQGKKPKND